MPPGQCAIETVRAGGSVQQDVGRTTRFSHPLRELIADTWRRSQSSTVDSG
jgi:hypothetical protein